MASGGPASAGSGSWPTPPRGASASELVERLAANSLEEAARILGIQPGDIVKSLVVKHKDGSFLFALIPGDRQISWPKLRALLGVNKLSLPTADVALEATGYERGHHHPARQHRGLAGVRGPDHHRAAGFPWVPANTATAPSWTPTP